MNNYFLETDRLYLRQMSSADFGYLAEMLQDKRVMYAWEYTFTDDDITDWINKNILRYQQYNMGYFILVRKFDNKIVGQAAIMPNTINGKSHIEIGYMLKYDFQKKGYASEIAQALVNYAFNKLYVPHVIFEIRPMNKPSRKIAEKLGAVITGSFIKTVKGKNMEHLIYTLNMGI